MNKRKLYRSRLGMKFATAAASALILAFSVFFLLYNGVTVWVLNGDRFDAFWAVESKKATESFQRYVSRHGLSTDEAIRDVSWEKGYRSAYLYLSPWQTPPEEDVLSDNASALGTPIRCADGVIYAFAEPSLTHFDLIGMVVSLGLAALCFFAILTPFVWHTLRRITHLSREMDILSGGDLSYSIVSSGRDELAELGQSIEAMRLSVLEQMAMENAAVLANSRLITSLSHDLRTPLTKLTGYLEILRYHKYSDEAQMERYLSSAIEKAAQMKALSDEMFRHFLVETPTEPDVESEQVSGSLLLSQLLSELCFDLNAEGFSADLPVIDSDFFCCLSVSELRRVLDNLFSNIKKYADPAQPVEISVHCETDEVCISIANRILPTARAESRGVGLPTVRALLSRIGGRLELSKSIAVFCARIFLPITAEAKNGD